MAFGLNKVQIIGRLGADVTVNALQQRRARRQHVGRHRRKLPYMDKQAGEPGGPDGMASGS